VFIFGREVCSPQTKDPDNIINIQIKTKGIAGH